MARKETPTSLEDILRDCFECKTPFDYDAMETFDDTPEGEDWSVSDVTDDGFDAYNKLIACVYGLANIGVIDADEADDIVESLDNILKGQPI